MKYILLVLFSLSLFFTACKKEEIKEPIPVIPIGMEDLKIASDFDWKTTIEYQINLSSKQDHIVTITNNSGIAYQKVFLKANKLYTMKLSIPSYEKQVHIIFMEQDVTLELNAANLEYHFQ